MHLAICLHSRELCIPGHSFRGVWPGDEAYQFQYLNKDRQRDLAYNWSSKSALTPVLHILALVSSRSFHQTEEKDLTVTHSIDTKKHPLPALPYVWFLVV